MKRASFRFILKDIHNMKFVGDKPTFGLWKISDKKYTNDLFKKLIATKITEKKLIW